MQEEQANELAARITIALLEMKWLDQPMGATPAPAKAVEPATQAFLAIRQALLAAPPPPKP